MVFSILTTISLITIVALMVKTRNMIKSSEQHPHHKVARDFFEKFPEYPENRDIKVEIECPLTKDTSETPVALSYKYRGHWYSHAYDYNALKQWFQEGKTCPSTNIHLLSNDVTGFQISFDIPANVVELKAKSQP
jgi:hypothetical protein